MEELELAEFNLNTAKAVQFQSVDFGRGGGIRTPDPLLPKQMRYQTALRPDIQFRLYRGSCSCPAIYCV